MEFRLYFYLSLLDLQFSNINCEFSFIGYSLRHMQQSRIDKRLNSIEQSVSHLLDSLLACLLICECITGFLSLCSVLQIPI